MAGFEFASEHDKEMFISLRSLAKAGGKWKSDKQRDFVMNRLARSDIECPNQYWGVPVFEDQKFFVVSAYMRWTNYGSRSMIPQIITFVLDSVGVVGQYKTNGNGNLREGWRPNPEKTTKVWERTDAE